MVQEILQPRWISLVSASEWQWLENLEFLKDTSKFQNE